MIALVTAATMAAALTVAPAHEATPKPCTDPTVKVIKAAGWKGRDVRTAWAITWRESNHRPGVVGAGSYGLFQLQASAWANRSWWDWDAVLTADGNARMAHIIWKALGWSPWGINKSGDGVDLRWYDWDSDTVQAWIWSPYVDGLRRFDRLPKACRNG